MQYFIALHQKSLYICHINGCGNPVGWRGRSVSADRAVGADPCECRMNRPKTAKGYESMTEAYETSKSKSKSAPAAFEMPKFEMPKFELPNFEMPKMEIPAAFREIAEKSVSQAKETYEKMKSAAEEATDM